MAEPSKPSIEDLQAQLVTLQEKQAENDAKIATLSEDNKKLTDDLNKAREVNTKLLLRIPTDDNPGKQEIKEEDSFDKLLDETIEKRITSKIKKTS